MFIPRYPIHIDIAIQDGVTVWTEEAQALHNKGAWLKNALPLDVFNSKDANLRALTNCLFEEVQAVIPKQFKSPPRGKQALKAVLKNLWSANLQGMPVRYSRTRSNYTQDKRYGQLFFHFDTLIPAIDALKTLGYIEQKKYRSRYEDKDKGYQGRIWASPKLIDLFIKHGLVVPGFYHKSEPEELIVLNKEEKTKGGNKKKVNIGYIETKHTIQMREDLKRYNSFTEQNSITVALPGDELVSYNFLFTLYKGILNNRIILEEVIYNNEIKTKGLHRDYINSNINKYYINNLMNTSKPEITITPLSTITRMDCCKDNTDKDLHRLKCFDWIWEFIWFLSEKYREMATERRSYDKRLYDEFKLDEIDIEYIKFRLNGEILHRVFNRKSFKKGGRAYGAFYQRLSKNIRTHILINNEPTIEIDFSAYHIRMLYHLVGIDYRKDPYIECGGKEYRKAFKCAGLVIINAIDEESGMFAIKDELEKNGIPLPDTKKPLRWMIDRFKETHPLIAKFICKDKGVELQNKDSHIMNAILMSLMDKNILGLSMFDSVIVAEQHSEVLKEIMTREYEKVMGFKPVF